MPIIKPCRGRGLERRRGATLRIARSTKKRIFGPLEGISKKVVITKIVTNFLGFDGDLRPEARRFFGNTFFSLVC